MELETPSWSACNCCPINTKVGAVGVPGVETLTTLLPLLAVPPMTRSRLPLAVVATVPPLLTLTVFEEVVLPTEMTPPEPVP